MRWRNVKRICPLANERCSRPCQRICRDYFTGKVAPIERVTYWPHGRYNGEPIVGVEVKLIVDLGQLRIRRFWWPYLNWRSSGHFVMWLCFQVRIEARYGW